MGAHDEAIRASLLAELRATRPGALVVQELDIGDGRADVAVIGAWSLEAFEIKSAADSVRRLARQVPAYDRIFDASTLVTARSHVAHAARTLPAWWGITLAEAGHLERARRPTINPGANPAYLLWSDEARRIAAELGVRGRAVDLQLAAHQGCRCHPSRVSKFFCARALAELPAERTRAIICATLRARRDWRLPDGRSVHGAELRAARERGSR